MTPTMDQRTMTGRELRWLADNREQAQQLRIETGERIRAVVQGRDETFVPVGGFYDPAEDPDEWIAKTLPPEKRVALKNLPAYREMKRAHAEELDENLWISPQGEILTAEEVLEAIARGQTRGPVPMLGRSYARYHTEEKETEHLMSRALDSHPAWEFLEQVPGIGATLAAKILSRLDPRKAPYCSSFWKYCGLSTVPGERYQCPECDVVMAFPVGSNVSGDHKRGGSGGPCTGKLEQIAGPEDDVRVAQPKPRKGEPASYDQYAKKVMWQIATSIIRTGARTDSAYERYYRRERQKAREERPNWSDGRQEYKARRKMQKLLLSHLWEVWREALGLDTPDPYIMEHGDGSHRYVGPWEFLEGKAA